MNELEKLEDDRVFSVRLCETRKYILFEECCDNYFSCSFDKNEVSNLIEQLEQLKNKME